MENNVALYYCNQCQSFQPYVNAEDQGIGTYEYWGAVGVDKNVVLTCPECDSEDIEESRYD